MAALGLLVGTSLSPPQTASRADRAQVERFAEQLLREVYANGNGPGAAVLVARGDELLYRGAIGMDDLRTGDMLSADDSFRIGSVTKQFAAAAVLKLAEDGKLALSDPLNRFLPDFPNAHRITVAQLLNHTSGVINYTLAPGLWNGALDQDLSTAEIIKGFREQQPDFAPGEGWNYSNSGYVLAGAVIEAASGMPWHAFLETAFFAPLGMAHTGHGHDPAVIESQARGWSLDGPRPVPPRAISMTIPHAAGALVSNLDDLHRWNRALHRGEVLSPASYALMTTPNGEAIAAGYGLGLFAGTVRGHLAFGHGGRINGFSASLDYLPGLDVSVVVLQNADSARPGHPGPEAIARRLAAAALGDPYPAADPVPVEPAALRAIEGVYRVDDSSSRRLRVVDGQLTSLRTGGRRQLLTPVGTDAFVFDDGLTRLTIERDAAGQITGMRFFGSGEGAGQFAPRIADLGSPQGQ